jgi:asparagine synthase (glutamine-hydrolysing)
MKLLFNPHGLSIKQSLVKNSPQIREILFDKKCETDGELLNWNVVKGNNNVLLFKGTIYRDHEKLDPADAFSCLFEINLNGEGIDRISGAFSALLVSDGGNELAVIRDRKGFLPVYYANFEDDWFVSDSSLELAESLPQRAINAESLRRYASLHYTAVWGRESFFCGVEPLAPGCILFIDKNGKRERNYWNWPEAGPLRYDLEGSIKKFYQLSRKATADILDGLNPTDTALALSGGMDSTSVLVFARELGYPLNCITASYKERRVDINEVEEARATAVHLGAQWNKIEITPADVIEKLSVAYEHHTVPIASSSIIAYEIMFSKAMELGYKNFILGGSADNLLNGNHADFLYNLIDLYLSGSNAFEEELESWIRLYATQEFPKSREIFFNFLKQTVPASADFINFRDRQIGDIFLKNSQSVTDSLSSGIFFRRTGTFLQTYRAFSHRYSAVAPMLDGMEALSKKLEISLLDPYLNPELEKFSETLAAKLKINKGINKYILRKMMEEKLPTCVVEKKTKIGFDLPFKHWMFEEPLSSFIHEILREGMNTELSEYIDFSNLHKNLVLGRYPISSMFVWQVINSTLWVKSMEKKRVRIVRETN